MASASAGDGRCKVFGRGGSARPRALALRPFRRFAWIGQAYCLTRTHYPLRPLRAPTGPALPARPPGVGPRPAMRGLRPSPGRLQLRRSCAARERAGSRGRRPRQGRARQRERLGGFFDFESRGLATLATPGARPGLVSRVSQGCAHHTRPRPGRADRPGQIAVSGAGALLHLLLLLHGAGFRPAV